ncbi:MAG: hypothetical protein V4471_00675 [Pseudomonadota bacterium]
MPKNYSTSELCDILELTNKKFSSLIEKNTEVSEKYSKITEAYQDLINLIDQNKPTNTIRELYKLEAQLGLIQCKLNSISLSPIDEAELQTKNKQLEELEKELNILINTTIQFKKKLPKNKAGLVNDYDAFLTQLNTYKAAWNTYRYNIQAAYYYNYADILIERIPKKRIKSFDTCIKNLEKAIFLFEKSASFYEKNRKLKEKLETDTEIAKTKATLKSLKQQASSSLDVIPHNRSDSTKKIISAEPSSMPSASNALTNEEMIKKNEVLPFKKRKYTTETITIFNNKKLARIQTNKMDKNVISIHIANPISVYSKLETLKNENFKKLEFILKKSCSIGFETFYLQLIFELAKFIKLDSNDVKNVFQHNLLTKLYLLDTLLHLINLFYHEKNKDIFINLQSQVLDIRNYLNTRYPTRQSWKFFHLDEIKKITLDEEGLRELFLMEIKNYLWGIEAISENPELGNDLLHDISALISNSIATNSIKYIIDDTLERAWVYLKNIRKEEQYFFYSRLSRELVKFYLAPENKNWAEINKVPLNNPIFLKELINWLSLAKFIALILNDKYFIEKIDLLKRIVMQKKLTQTTHRFFNLTDLDINDEKLLAGSVQTLFNKQFKLHIEGFHFIYDLPLTSLSNIYAPLIHFIERQVETFKFEAKLSNTNNNYSSIIKN